MSRRRKTGYWLLPTLAAAFLCRALWDAPVGCAGVLLVLCPRLSREEVSSWRASC